MHSRFPTQPKTDPSEPSTDLAQAGSHAQSSASRAHAVPRTGSGFRPDIEGLRGLAILLVVAYHAGVPPLQGGYIGVDVFFVLSGFLISRLLVDEMSRTGRVDLTSFFARRARRLLPAQVVMLLSTIAVATVVFAPMELRSMAASATATAAYLSNVYFARGATDYLGADAELNPFLHTWSLSVEEQFYLVWPLFLVVVTGALRRRGRAAAGPALALCIGALAAGSLFLCVALTSTLQPWAFFLSPMRAWEFAFGALAALMPVSTWPPRPREASTAVRLATEPASRRVLLASLQWCALGGILITAAVYDSGTTFPGWTAIVPALATAILLRMGELDRPWSPDRLLRARVLQEAGRLSYSWYLWHWPMLVFGEALGMAGTMQNRIALVLLSLAFAELSYRLVENPVRHSRWLSPRPTLSVQIAMVTTAFSLCISLAWLQAARHMAERPAHVQFTRARDDVPELYARGCHATFYDVTSRECSLGVTHSPRIAVLFGDSHAAQWVPALDAFASAYGLRLVLMTKSACPAVLTPVRAERLGREYYECDQWQQHIVRRIHEMKPSLVIMSSSYKYPFSLAEWLEGTRTALDAVGPASGRVVVLRDTPLPGFDVPTCLARVAWRFDVLFSPKTCVFERSNEQSETIYAAQMQAAEQFQNATTVDMSDMICELRLCAPIKGGVVVYRDDNHLTGAFVKRLGSALAERIASRAWPTRVAREEPGDG